MARRRKTNICRDILQPGSAPRLSSNYAFGYNYSRAEQKVTKETNEELKRPRWARWLRIDQWLTASLFGQHPLLPLFASVKLYCPQSKAQQEKTDGRWIFPFDLCCLCCLLFHLTSYF
jgi:hypothetical protein